MFIQRPTLRRFQATTAILLAVGIFAVSQRSIVPVVGQEANQDNATTKLETGDVHVGSSRVFIHVGKTGLGHEHGVEGRLQSGTLRLDGDSPEGKLVFDMTTFVADTASARKYVGLGGTTDAGTQQKVNANMRGSAVLNVRHFPTATFVVTGVTPKTDKSRRGLPQWEIEGNFTLHGQTRQIRFTADVGDRDTWHHVRGGFRILQTDFGITPYSTAFGAIGVANQLTIWGDLWVAK